MIRTCLQERDEADGVSSCSAGVQPETVQQPALPRIWQSALDAPDERGAAPPPFPRALPAADNKGGGSPMIKAGTKDVNKLRRGPATHGGAAGGPAGAISG